MCVNFFSKSTFRKTYNEYALFMYGTTLNNAFEFYIKIKKKHCFVYKIKIILKMLSNFKVPMYNSIVLANIENKRQVPTISW